MSSIDHHRDHRMGIAGGWEISKRDGKPQKGKGLVQLSYHQQNIPVNGEMQVEYCGINLSNSKSRPIQ